MLLEREAVLEKKSAGKKECPMPLLFSPLLGGNSKRQVRVRQGIRILRKAEQVFPEQDIRKMEAILYILAVKFLNEEELKQVKEEFAMTKLGQMIWEDALEKGREEGERIGREHGERQASERYSRLILILNGENKADQIVKIASDPKYREELYRKYGI